MFDIRKITLLSEEQYKTHKRIIPAINAPWWLLSPGCTQYQVCSVDKYGNVDNGYNYHVGDILGVRPALLIDNTGLSYTFGDKIFVFGHSWTVLSNTLNEICVLCDECIDYRRYDAIDNEWEGSDLYVWLNDWLKEKKNHNSLTTILDEYTEGVWREKPLNYKECKHLAEFLLTHILNLNGLIPDEKMELELKKWESGLYSFM